MMAVKGRGEVGDAEDVTLSSSWGRRKDVFQGAWDPDIRCIRDGIGSVIRPRVLTRE